MKLIFRFESHGITTDLLDDNGMFKVRISEGLKHEVLHKSKDFSAISAEYSCIVMAEVNRVANN